ncbi:MAG: GTPase domain-containing protein [Planctomycetes bacterium]|nr:GTPase domain-containing protein [Planctomycetota bacterium]
MVFTETAAHEPPHARAELARFVTRLRAGYGAVRARGGAATGVADECLVSLELADSALRLRGLRDARPVQIAVIGPTQTGKSTVVNLLLGDACAAVSPLAGFTVHAQGFSLGADIQGAWTEAVFPDWRRNLNGALDRSELGVFALTQVERTGPTPRSSASEIRDCVVWDTPDFDSIESAHYRKAVLECAALADVLVLVVSKEKYADLSVWRMLHLLDPLTIQLVVCLNKMTPDAEAAIRASLLERLAGLRTERTGIPVVSLPYRSGFGMATDAAAEAGPLREAVAKSAAAGAAARAPAGLVSYLRAHWAEWLAPVEAERAARRAWSQCVRIETQSALTAYRDEYLEHPQRYDAFRRATAELLSLLELPGVGGALETVRRVVTWPARAIVSAGKGLLQSSGRAPAARRNSEQAVLDALGERLTTSLLREAMRQAATPEVSSEFWRALVDRIVQEQARLRSEVQSAGERARDAFQPEISAAAGRLYELLRERPALLNSLRAARATTDLAGIVLAVKTGGLHVNDLLLAPAMFALTSLLTEGALGGYMTHVVSDLKRRQYEHMKSRLFEQDWPRIFADAGESLSDRRLFGISADEADEATKLLAQWEGGNA